MKRPDFPKLDEVPDTGRKKVDIQSTFCALAVRRLGAESLSERTAKAAEQTAANTKKLIREANMADWSLREHWPCPSSGNANDSRENTVGIDNLSVDLIYVVDGTKSDAEVRATIEGTIPAMYAGLVFQNYPISHQGGGLWEVTVRYGKRERKQPGKSSFSSTLAAAIAATRPWPTRTSASTSWPTCAGAGTASSGTTPTRRPLSSESSPN